jgi:hypothetical protein
VLFVLSWCLLAGLTAIGQENGRFAGLKAQALEYFQRGQYAQVVGKLEEVWEQDQTDPKVAEYLAMGYLYGESDAKKAEPVMLAAIAHGGQATFLVQHSHERSTILSGDTMNNYCTGRISVANGKMDFIADSTDHSATFLAPDLKEFRILNGSAGRFQIKSGAKTSVFRVKSQTRDEAALLERLARQNLK